MTYFARDIIFGATVLVTAGFAIPIRKSVGLSSKNIRSGYSTEDCSRGESTLCETNTNVKGSAESTTSFPGYSLYFEIVPWLRLVTCLLDFSRFQRCD